MRLLQARRLQIHSDDGRLLRTVVVIEFSAGGVRGRLELEPPENWDQLTRSQKVAWVKQQIAGHLTRHIYEEPDEVVFPDLAVRDQAADDFEALPGWATWTAAEAENWIEQNVTSLASAKIALRAMAQAIVFLRDRSIER